MEAPLALIAGDSISIGYTPHVRKLLEGRFKVEHHPDNGGTSANMLHHMAEWILLRDPDVIHINAGLHDLAVDPGKEGPRITTDQYEKNLREIVRRLKSETSARIIWATTTPVVDEWHARVKGFIRRDTHVRVYNRIARKVMEKAGVEINDLYQVIMDADPKKCIKPDGVHMNDHGNHLLAGAVAKAIAGDM